MLWLMKKDSKPIISPAKKETYLWRQIQRKKPMHTCEHSTLGGGVVEHSLCLTWEGYHFSDRSGMPSGADFCHQLVVLTKDAQCLEFSSQLDVPSLCHSVFQMCLYESPILLHQLQKICHLRKQKTKIWNDAWK